MPERLRRFGCEPDVPCGSVRVIRSGTPYGGTVALHLVRGVVCELSLRR
jgi:hypothetical protein